MSLHRRFQRRRQIPEEDGSVEDLVLAVAWNDLNASADEKRTVDEKANILLVTNGVVMGLIVAAFDRIDPRFGITALIALFLSAVLAVIALQVRNFTTIGAMSLWNALEKLELLNNPIQAKRNLMATLNGSIAINRKEVKRVIILVKVSNFIFLIGLVLTAGAFVLKLYQWVLPF